MAIGVAIRAWSHFVSHVFTCWTTIFPKFESGIIIQVSMIFIINSRCKTIPENHDLILNLNSPFLELSFWEIVSTFHLPKGCQKNGSEVAVNSPSCFSGCETLACLKTWKRCRYWSSLDNDHSPRIRPTPSRKSYVVGFWLSKSHFSGHRTCKIWSLSLGHTRNHP